MGDEAGDAVGAKADVEPEKGIAIVEMPKRPGDSVDGDDGEGCGAGEAAAAHSAVDGAICEHLDKKDDKVGNREDSAAADLFAQCAMEMSSGKASSSSPEAVVEPPELLFK
jgi:hypothetical protein